MRVRGTKVVKSRVKFDGDDRLIILYGQSPRGTPVMVGAIQTTRQKMAADLAAGPQPKISPSYPG